MEIMEPIEFTEEDKKRIRKIWGKLAENYIRWQFVCKLYREGKYSGRLEGKN